MVDKKAQFDKRGRSFTTEMVVMIPVNQDPELKLPVGEDQYRCSGCNLPTNEDDGWVCAAPLLGYMQGVEINLAVCEGCFKVARDNAGEGEPAHKGPEREGDQWLYPPHLRPKADVRFFRPSIRSTGEIPEDSSDYRAGETDRAGS
jgi:hypothetical protein